MTVILVGGVTISSVPEARWSVRHIENEGSLVWDGVTEEEGSQDKMMVEDFFQRGHWSGSILRFDSSKY